MAIESIGTVLSNPQVETQQTSLGQEDLFEIMLTQLTYQDPLKPLDNQEFIAQLAQFTGLEQSKQTNDNMEALLTMNAASQSIGLIGKTVQVQTVNGGEIGDVTTVSFNSGSPLLTVMTSTGEFLNNISLSQVSLVRN